MSTYGLVSWRKQGGEPLNPEELEVCKLSTLIIQNASIPRPGVTVMLQFKQTLWEGSVLSVHGKKKDAEAALIEVVTPTSTPKDSVVPESTTSTKKGRLGRPRKKKSFGDDFVHDENQGLSGEGEKDVILAAADGNKQVSLSGKKDTSTANKEKKREKEKRKEERQKQRRVLAEQNSLLLSRMLADEEEDEDIGNACDLVQDCMEILHIPQNPVPQNVHCPVQNPVQNSPQNRGQPFQPPSSTSVITPMQNLLQSSCLPTRNIASIQTPPQTSPSTPQVNVNFTQSPDQLLQPHRSTNVTLLLTPLQMQSQVATSNFTPQQARPQLGGKCPRRRQLDEDSECSSCKRLKEEMLNLKKQLASYEAPNDQPAPKPGRVMPAIANQYKMIELSPSSGVYVFDKHIDQALARKSATSCAAFLLNCFYTNLEMAGMNLTGANGKPCPDKEVVESILAFTMKKHQCSAAVLKASLRNKFAANTSRAKKADI